MLYQDAFLQRLEDGLRTALPSWGMQQTAPLRLLTISENATFLADDEARGSKIVLRVHRPEYHTDAAILSELAWLEALRADNVVETPRPIAARDGSLLCSFLDGATRRNVVAFEFMSGKEPDAESDLVKWYGKLGEINARLHLHSRSWKRPDGFVRKVWNFDTIIGATPDWGDWREGLGLDAEGKAILERASVLLEKGVRAFGTDAERFGLVHCDMRPANLLVDGERLGVIDFDDCGFSWFAYDFAAAVSFQESEPYIPELMAVWLDNYRKIAPFSAEDEAAIPMFLMLRRMQLTAWIASHSETPTAQSMGVPYTHGTVTLAETYLTQRG